MDPDDPRVDAQVFEKGIKKQFGDLTRNFSGVVDNIRTKDYTVFVKVNKDKAEVNEREGAYNKLDEELKKLKTQLDKANQAK